VEQAGTDMVERIFHHLCCVCELNQSWPQVHFAYFALLYWKKTKRILISIVDESLWGRACLESLHKDFEKKQVKLYSLVVEPTHPKKC